MTKLNEHNALVIQEFPADSTSLHLNYYQTIDVIELAHNGEVVKLPFTRKFFRKDNNQLVRVNYESIEQLIKRLQGYL